LTKTTFFTEGTGREEAKASGGDLAMGQTADVVERWDTTCDERHSQVKQHTFRDSSARHIDAAGAGGAHSIARARDSVYLNSLYTVPAPLAFLSIAAVIRDPGQNVGSGRH
jgi:hypothetical protein